MAQTQTVVWAASAGTSTRSDKTGSGGSKRIWAGFQGGKYYNYFIRFATNWAGVGRIVKATLVVYTDDWGGVGLTVPGTSDVPAIYVRQLLTPFTVGASADGVYSAADFTSSGGTVAGQVAFNPTKEINGVNRIDITALVNGWAPKTVTRSDGQTGAGSAVYGLLITGQSPDDDKKDWAGWSEDATSGALRPTIELVYEYGPTVPTTPTNLSPSGSVVSIGSFQGDFADIKTLDQLRYSEVEVYTSAATNAGQVVTGGTRVYQKRKLVTNTETINKRFNHVPDSLAIPVNTTYKWRGRTTDQEGQTSLWTNLVSFSVSNTNPNAPTLSAPPAAGTYATLDGIQFQGNFTDPDAGDRLLAYEVQLSAYPAADTHWDDPTFVLWDTGKEYVAYGATTWSTPYGGQALAAGTYYWRARVWDHRDGVSAWTTQSIVLSASFVPEPGTASSIQVRPLTPWRIVIKDMYQSDGVTKTVGRAPGRTVAILEDAKSVGASILYNSPGEAHWTLPVDHPQISVIEPKQTHYSIQFWHGDGWREVYAGLVWDFDSTEKDIVFYGIDYLALYDYILDERYDPAIPNKAAELGGSYYVTTGKNTINYIVTDQLTRAKNLLNSPVGFITIGPIATMTEPVSVYSTYQPTLAFVTGLLDSHRAGSGSRTRLQVRQKTGGGYEVAVIDNPGTQRDNLRLRYGELVQGYRVVAFGKSWGSRFSGIGRTRDGLKVRYNTQTAPGIDEAIWGRFVKAGIVDGIADDNDLARRVRQLAIASGKLGKQVGLGLRSGVLQPRDGYDLTDTFPISIEHGAVSTTKFGSGYWACMGITWEASDQGQQVTTLTMLPREDGTAPSSNLLQLSKISPQREWQIGWRPPDPLLATSLYWLDQTTNKVYIRDTTTGVARPITGTV